MKITVELRTIHKNTNSPLKATANIVLDDAFVIRNVRLIETENSRFLSMPSYRGRDEQWRSNCHPITPEFRKELETAAFEAYEAE